ncbi:MAG: VOC family protein [Anaerolineae bacterium]|nr:VOC family protein [Anaerolineae bacterium]
MKIQGLHHITLVSSDAQRTVDFYVKVLGLRFVKQTVNFDDPSAYHLYFGDATGSPGSAITFFEWKHAPKGLRGIGGTHHLALSVQDYNGLLKWKRRLTDLGFSVNGPYDRHYFQSIYFTDPDGVILEIATMGPGMLIDEDEATLGQAVLTPPQELTRSSRDEASIDAETWHQPVERITADMALMYGMHHISVIGSNIQATDAFYRDVLGMQRVKKQGNFDDPNSAHWYWGMDNGRPGTLVTYFEHSPENVRYARMGTGLTHHFALAVQDEDEQEEWRKRLAGAGYRVSPIMDRDYFRSIYSHDPDGHIVELATVDPGFAVDEDPAELGQRLQLPAWLEKHRSQIENSLTPLVIPEWVNPLETEDA